MIDFTKPVRTKGTKQPVEILTTKGRGRYSVLGYIGENRELRCWLSNGVSAACGIYNLENIDPRETVIEAAIAWRKVYASTGSRTNACQELAAAIDALQGEKK